MIDDKLIIVYGTRWCPDSRRAERLFRSKKIPFEFVDIDKNETGKCFVERINNGFRSVPTIVFPNGFIIVEPSDQQLSQAIEENYSILSE